MHRLPLFSALALIVSCATQDAATRPVAAPAPAPVLAPAPASETKLEIVAPEWKKFTVDAARPLPAGLDESAFDFTADPCTDFYQYACGGWMAKTEIPADRPGYSRGFVMISERNEQYLKGILDEAAASKLPAGTPFARQMGDYFATCMDEAKLEQALPELKRLVASVTQVKTAKELAKAVGALHASSYSAFFEISAGQDLKNSSEVIAALDQGGLGLPDRDYYTDEDATKKTIREGYVAYVGSMLELYGQKADEAKQGADTVMALETRLAKVSQTRVERRDPQKLYNRVDRKGLKELASDFPWDEYFTAVGAKDVQAVNVNSVPYFKELAAIARDTSPEAWKAYLTWVVLRGSVPALPKKFQDTAFGFSSKSFSGAKEDRPRWKKCVAFTDSVLGEAVGREFARRYFGEDGKARTAAMVESLQQSFERNLAGLAWMDDATKQAALGKVKRMVGNNKIGYPSVWRDYTSMKTARTGFLTNSLEASRFEARRQLAKIGKPVDRTEWLMSAPTVNAYYDAQKNEIVFPAGILQPPFFNREASDAVNFGAMGMVVGHEITHGFDDEGRQYDADGNLKDWWSDASGKNFVGRVECVKKQYDNYVAVDDVKLKGDLTLGENVADLGGLKLSHSAMEAWYAKKGGVDDATARFNTSQQFFLGFAQSWCTKMRPEMARMRAATDPHSTPYWRVNGPLGNNDAFKGAFSCPNTAKMIRTAENRCAVW